MDRHETKKVLKELQRIPGVGPSIAVDLYDMGFRAVNDLKGRDPEDMYLKHCAIKGTTVDRCVLYVFRCAVYFASQPDPDPDLLKWWNWKKRPFPAGRF